MTCAAQFLFLPHAGGSAADLLGFAKLVCPAGRRHLLELPGRGRRRREAPLLDRAAALDDLEAQAEARLGAAAGPLVFAGHSFGSYLAWMLARRFRARGARVLVVALSNAPPHLRGMVCAGERALLDLVDRLGGVPDILRHDPEMLERFLGLLRADLAVADGLPRDLGDWRDDIPLITGQGERDPVTRDGARWSEITGRSHSHLTVPGGHFVVRDSPEVLAAAILASAIYRDWLEAAQARLPDRGPGLGRVEVP